MAFRFFFPVATLLISAAAAGFFVAAGWKPWMYPVIAFVVLLAVWGFAARRRRPVAPLDYRRRHPEEVAGKGAARRSGGRAGHYRNMAELVQLKLYLLLK